MRRLWGFSAAVLAVTMTSCAFSETPKIQSGSSIENPEYVPPSAVTENAEDIDEESRIICKVRHYSPDSYVKSDMIFQADGRIYCGFYMQNEGEISAENVLNAPDGTEQADFRLMDDKWLDACINGNKSDNFALFGETYELGHLNEADTKQLCELISGIDADSGHIICGKSADGWYHTDFVTEGSDGYVRIRAFADLPQYSDVLDDENAQQAHDIVMNTEADFFQEWEKLCSEHMNDKY